MIIIWALLGKIVFMTGELYSSISPQLFLMCQMGILINSILMILNLFPIPPLDGSRVLSAFLPPVWAYRYNQMERYGLLILILLLATGTLGKILGPLLFGFVNFVNSFLVS